MSSINRKKWKQEMLNDYPSVDPYFIDVLLDLYEKNPDYVKKLSKKKFKDFTPKEIPREVVGVVDVIPADDTDTINKYFKAPIEIKEDDEPLVKITETSS